MRLRRDAHGPSKGNPAGRDRNASCGEGTSWVRCLAEFIPSKSRFLAALGMTSEGLGMTAAFRWLAYLGRPARFPGHSEPRCRSSGRGPVCRTPVEFPQIHPGLRDCGATGLQKPENLTHDRAPRLIRFGPEGRCTHPTCSPPDRRTRFGREGSWPWGESFSSCAPPLPRRRRNRQHPFGLEAGRSSHCPSDPR